MCCLFLPKVRYFVVNLTNMKLLVKIKIMKTDHKKFETLLKTKGISKKAFSAYSGIPYYTVAGWKKSNQVPTYTMVLLGQMPSSKEYVTAGELIDAGLPKAILWNNDPQKKVPIDIFIVATLERTYNDFVIEKLAEFFGGARILSALLKYKDRVSNTLVQQVISYLQHIKAIA